MVEIAERFGKKELSQSAEIRLSKYISLGVGIAVVLLSLVMGKIKGNLWELSFKTANLLVLPLFVPFFMAMFIRRATTFGTLVGTLASTATAIMVGYSTELFGIDIPFLWIMPISFVVGAVVSIVLSVIRPDKNGGSENNSLLN